MNVATTILSVMFLQEPAFMMTFHQHVIAAMKLNACEINKSFLYIKTTTFELMVHFDYSISRRNQF